MRAEDVRVTIDGQPSFVYGLLKHGMTYGTIPTVPSEFTAFDLAQGPVRVVVDYGRTPISRAVVRPERAGIATTIRGSRVLFDITKPGVYDVEINGSIYEHPPVLIFANTPDFDKPPGPAPGVTIFKAGTVSNVGLLRITQPNSRIYIEGGAVVRGAILVDGVAGVRIGGPGVLLYDDETVSELKTKSDPIQALGARDLRIDNLTVVSAPSTFVGANGGPDAPWAVDVAQSSGVTIRNLKIVNELRDGLDIDGSDHVQVSDSFVQAHDDGICLKSTSGPGRSRDVFDIDVQHSVIINTGPGNALQIGVELHGSEVRAVRYAHIDILHALRNASAISITNGDKAAVHGILYDDIRVEDRPGRLIHFSIIKDPYIPDILRGSISDVTLRNVSSDASAPSEVAGYDADHRINGITVDGLQIGARFVNNWESLGKEMQVKDAAEPAFH